MIGDSYFDVDRGGEYHELFKNACNTQTYFGEPPVFVARFESLQRRRIVACRSLDLASSILGLASSILMARCVEDEIAMASTMNKASSLTASEPCQSKHLQLILRMLLTAAGWKRRTRWQSERCSPKRTTV